MEKSSLEILKNKLKFRMNFKNTQKNSLNLLEKNKDLISKDNTNEIIIILLKKIGMKN